MSFLSQRQTRTAEKAAAIAGMAQSWRCQGAQNFDIFTRVTTHTHLEVSISEDLEGIL